MINKLNRIFKRLIDIKFYKCLFDRQKLIVLQRIYQFNKWHANAPYSCRPYKKVLVNEINNLNINSVAVEIGGGLGDIISKIKTKKKYLIDLDSKLEKIIYILHKNILFVHGSFDEVKTIPEKNIDILILINWIHELDKDIILNSIYKIKKTKKIKYLILDEINNNMQGYKHKHRFNNIDGFITIKLIDDPEKIRKFRVLKCQHI